MKRPWVNMGFSFMPSVNVKSKRILEKRRSKSREGLGARESPLRSRQSSPGSTRRKGGFRINSSIGTYEQHFYHVNQCKLTGEVPRLFT